MADVRILKFDVGSPTDQTLANVQQRLGASTNVEAFRRGLAIADKMTELLLDKKQKVYVEDEQGNRREIIVAGL